MRLRVNLDLLGVESVANNYCRHAIKPATLRPGHTTVNHGNIEGNADLLDLSGKAEYHQTHGLRLRVQFVYRWAVPHNQSHAKILVHSLFESVRLYVRRFTFHPSFAACMVDSRYLMQISETTLVSLSTIAPAYLQSD